MEVAATHRDPKLALALAVFIAEETVKLNRDTGQARDADLAASAWQSLETATGSLRAAEAASDGVSRRMPTPEALREELGRLDTMRTDVSRAALSAGLSYRGTEEPDQRMAQELDRQALALDRQAAARHELLARRTAEIGAAETQLRDARSRYEQARKRLDDLEASSGLRGERLSLLDPGVAPERPSSPNVPLNVFAGLALGAIFSLLYLTAEYGLRQQRAEAMREARWASARP
jgi:uncharacterized protein involved in exopolysaccharide biosynthesis